jgi:hypothetical protein
MVATILEVPKAWRKNLVMDLMGLVEKRRYNTGL